MRNENRARYEATLALSRTQLTRAARLAGDLDDDGATDDLWSMVQTVSGLMSASLEGGARRPLKGQMTMDTIASVPPARLGRSGPKL